MEEENKEHLKRFRLICSSISRPELPPDRRREYLLRSYGIDPQAGEENYYRELPKGRIDEELRRKMAINWSRLRYTISFVTLLTLYLLAVYEGLHLFLCLVQMTTKC